MICVLSGGVDSAVAAITISILKFPGETATRIINEVKASTAWSMWSMT
jgi:adenylyl- and sulfurtransferase ThiI